jgi:hypothetical protein
MTTQSLHRLDGEELYRAVRAALLVRGSSFNRWCSEHGVSRQYATAAVKGALQSEPAKALKARVIRELTQSTPAKCTRRKIAG